jgi:carbamoyltransferase
MSNIIGISAGFHDAGISVVNQQGDILFAGHSERFSKKKNDPNLCAGILDAVEPYYTGHLAYYETPWRRQLRSLRSGEGFSDVWTTKRALRDQLGNYFLNPRQISSSDHHKSHAAAGFQTSPFAEAAVVVIDAIGESDTISIYDAYYDPKGRAQYHLLWRQKYPHSIGMFFSAVTKRVGLRPMDEEYITMGMAAWGDNKAYRAMYDLVVDSITECRFKENFHIGVPDNWLDQFSDVELAYAAQKIVEQMVDSVMLRASHMTRSMNVVYMGGVALNCVANSHMGKFFSNFWIMPNPGDCGSSLGAAALAHGGKLNWEHPYLGTDITGPYPVGELVKELKINKIVGVASGRAEFGPRALGNRSLLADPRGTEIKDQVNEIKRRQKFRPFAPVILEEYVSDYFSMPYGWHHSRYMQTVARCRNPDVYPAIVHVDGSSRVQTVPKDCGSGIRQLLEAWYAETGCPMLLNTSLNIRGEPMVDDRADADRFEEKYGVRVCS